MNFQRYLLHFPHLLVHLGRLHRVSTVYCQLSAESPARMYRKAQLGSCPWLVVVAGRGDTRATVSGCGGRLGLRASGSGLTACIRPKKAYVTPLLVLVCFYH
jgi:hypothetical protein